MPYINKSLTDSWTTPIKIKQQLQDEFNFDDFDPCPLNDDPSFDGLTISWSKRTFVNPPYSKLKSTKKNGIGWIEKAHKEAQKGKLIVLLIPARTDTTWFHDIILKNNYEVRFIKGRLKFGDKSGAAPFPSIIVIMRRKQRRRRLTIVAGFVGDGAMCEEEEIKKKFKYPLRCSKINGEWKQYLGGGHFCKPEEK